MFNADWITVVGAIGGGLAAVVLGQWIAERAGLTRVVHPAPTPADRRRLVEAVVQWAAAGPRASPSDLMNLCLPPRRRSRVLDWLSPLVIVSALGLLVLALMGDQTPPAWALAVAFGGLLIGMLGLASSSAREVVPIATDEANFRVAVVQAALESVWRRESPDRLAANLNRLLESPQAPAPSATIPMTSGEPSRVEAGRRAA